MKKEKILKAMYRFITSSDWRFIYLANAGKYNYLSDEEYVKRMYKAVIGKELNLEHPETFNEKIQWLKLYDHNPLYTTMVDKYEAKKYVANIIGEEYIIPTLGVWDNPDDIDFDKLPNQFVLKCNHNSGLGMCICKDKSKLNYEKVRDKLRKGLAQDYYLLNREWPYKDVPRKIIAEKYMSDNKSEVEINDVSDLKDYKIMCFEGVAKCSFVCSERFSETGMKVTFYDTNWEIMPFERHYPRSANKIAKPINYEKMIDLAEKLAKDIPFARVDFYEVQGKCYFGEITLYPGSGMEEFSPSEWDKQLGDWIKMGYFISVKN